MRDYIQAHGGGMEMIGIDAGEAHRAKPREGRTLRWPLIELDMDRDDCIQVIASAGLPVPPKSGCWHCPFMRVGEVLALAKTQPERFALIEKLEAEAEATHGVGPAGFRSQWGDKPASHWRRRATLEATQDANTMDFNDTTPCGCYDG